MITREQCRGCEDDFYNHRTNMDGGNRCWSAAKAKMKVRFRIGTWTMPATPFAFTEVCVPSCYRQRGEHFTDKLPDFVKLSEVTRLRPTIPRSRNPRQADAVPAPSAPSQEKRRGRL